MIASFVIASSLYKGRRRYIFIVTIVSFDPHIAIEAWHLLNCLFCAVKMRKAVVLTGSSAVSIHSNS